MFNPIYAVRVRYIGFERFFDDWYVEAETLGYYAEYQVANTKAHELAADVEKRNAANPDQRVTFSVGNDILVFDLSTHSVEAQIYIEPINVVH